VPLGRQEREAHRAAHEDRVGAAQEGVHHADLVGHLRAADDRHQRAGGILEDAGQRLDLALQQQPGRALLHVVGDALRRRVRPVRRPEGVVDVDVAEPRVRARELGVVARLARLVADVLEHEHVARCEVLGEGLDLRPHDRRRQRHVRPGQLGQAVGRGSQGQLGLAGLRPAEVRRQDDAGAAPAQRLDRRQRRADARVVGDRAVLQRYVEVHAHEHAPSLDLDVVEPSHVRD
jgi:hypothetical protein